MVTKTALAPTQQSKDDSSRAPANLADLYLLCFIPSPLFHAHWSIFVPSQLDPPRGTVINVRGDPLHGFVHEFERGYCPAEDTDKPPHMVKLAALDERLIRSDGPLEPGIEATACTELERVALSVDAPGSSLGRRGSRDGRTRVEIRDCQWWVHQFLARLIEMDVVGASSQDVLDKAPQH